MMRILAALVLVVLGGIAYIRLAPINLPAYFGTGVPSDIGDYPEAGGFTAVRVIAGPDDVGKVTSALMALPRTQVLDGATDMFVTRSRVFGFPDVTQVLVENGHLIVRGHLIFGKSDLGVNKARILAALTSI